MVEKMIYIKFKHIERKHRIGTLAGLPMSEDKINRINTMSNRNSLALKFNKISA